MKIGLQARFSLLIVALILVLVGVLSGGLLLQVRTLTEEIRSASGEVVGEAMLDQIQEDGKALAETLADNLPNHLYFFRMDTIKELTRSVKNQNIIYVYVHDANGVILQDGTRTMESLGLDINDGYLRTMLETKKVVAWFTSHETGRDEGERVGTAIAGVQAYHVSAPVILGGDVIGGVRIGLGLKNIRADIAAEQKRLTDISETRLDRLLVLAGTATVVLLLLGIILAVILGRWLSRHVRSARGAMPSTFPKTATTRSATSPCRSRKWPRTLTNVTGCRRNWRSTRRSVRWTTWLAASRTTSTI